MGSSNTANSAVRQLFPAKSPPSALTAEALKAFEESKRSGNLLTASQTITSAGSSSSTSTSPTPLSQSLSSSDTDTLIKRSIERNALRRSLIKYEPKYDNNIFIDPPLQLFIQSQFAPCPYPYIHTRSAQNFHDSLMEFIRRLFG